MNKRIVVLAFILVGCNKVTNANKTIDASTAIDATTTVDAASAPCDNPYQAREARARIAAEFYLGHPVTCGRGGPNGATCFDMHGGVVWCPVALTTPCTGRRTAKAPTVTINATDASPVVEAEEHQ